MRPPQADNRDTLVGVNKTKIIVLFGLPVPDVYVYKTLCSQQNGQTSIFELVTQSLARLPYTEETFLRDIETVQERQGIAIKSIHLCFLV